MINSFKIILGLYFLILFSCGTTTKDLKSIIHGNITGFEGKYLVARYMNFNGGTKVHLDSALIENGKFSFEFINKDIMCLDFIIKDTEIGSNIVFAEPGEISILAHKDSLINQFGQDVLNFKVTGSKTHDELTQFEQSRKGTKDSIFLNYIKNHPDSYLSAVFMITTPKAEYLYDSLSERVKKCTYGLEVEERILRPKAISNGMKANVFAGKDSNGKSVSLDSFKGKFVFVEFWASWCKPCRQGHPKLRKFYNSLNTNKVEMISISTDTKDRKQTWLDAIKQDSVDSWTQCLVSELNNDPKKKYNIESIPTYFLLDTNGIILQSHGNSDTIFHLINSLTK
jgi:thiol-disulfide isomerase/thioredoxin